MRISRSVKASKTNFILKLSQTFGRTYVRIPKLISMKHLLNINQLMSDELLSNNRLVEKHSTPPAFEPLTSRSINSCTVHSAIRPLLFHYFYFAAIEFILATKFSENDRDHSKMKNESVKNSREKSNNVLEAQKAQAKNLIKKDQHVHNNCYKLRSRAIKN